MIVALRSKLCSALSMWAVLTTSVSPVTTFFNWTERVIVTVRPSGTGPRQVNTSPANSHTSVSGASHSLSR